MSNYIFYPWEKAEIKEYDGIRKNTNGIYPKEVNENPLHRTEFILKKLNVSEKEYEFILRYTGRPQALTNLESTLLKTNQPTFS